MKKSSLSGIYLVVFLDVLGFGIIIPVIRDLTIFLSDSSALSLDHATLSGILMSCYSFAQFLFAPLLGSLSDRYGRKSILLISVFGNVVSYLMWMVSQDYYFFLLSRLISGITGGNISVAQSYIADVTPKKDRAKAMGMFGAVFGIGFVIGPFLGGLLSTFDMTKIDQNTIIFNPFSSIGLFCAVLSFGNLFLIKYNLTESLPLLKAGGEGRGVENRGYEREHGKGVQKKIVWNPLHIISLTGLTSQLKKLIIVNLLFSSAFVFLESTLAWDLLFKFNLDARETGIVFACMGLFLVFVQGGIYRGLQKKFSLKKIIQWGLVIIFFSFALYPFMERVVAFYFVLLMITFSLGIVNPSLTALVSLEAEKTEQGLSLGFMQSFASLARGVVPVTATFFYDYVSMSAPGLSASLLAVLSLVLIFYRTADQKKISCLSRR